MDKRKRKIFGIILALGGALVARLKNFIPLQTKGNLIFFLGVLFALIGITIFASAMKRLK